MSSSIRGISRENRFRTLLRAKRTRIPAGQMINGGDSAFVIQLAHCLMRIRPVWMTPPLRRNRKKLGPVALPMFSF